jgi:hypothetical protein
MPGLQFIAPTPHVNDSLRSMATAVKLSEHTGGHRLRLSEEAFFLFSRLLF